MLDCVITGGSVVDGTGTPARQANVGISDGRIAYVGPEREPARRVIDASGRVVAPGFIDIHTHYDAQIMWDPTATPSSLHGVTTVIGGNCGFGIAPIEDAVADYVLHMLACVEGMPAASLEAALEFSWRSFGEWLARLDGNLGVNAGFLVGHSTIRRLVMREGSHELASDDQVQAMAAMVEQSVREGALGFSSSWGDVHADHHGDRVPSRCASAEELVALASTLRDYEGTVLEFIPSIAPVFPEPAIDVMVAMSAAAGRPLNWNLLTAGGHGQRDTNAQRLHASDLARERGGEVLALALPIPLQVRLNLLTTIAYNSMPTWRESLLLPTMRDKLAALRSPERRAKMASEVVAERSRRVTLVFDEMTVESVVNPALKHLEGQPVAAIARERGITALEAFLDVAADDELLTCFRTAAAGDDDAGWTLRAEYWQDPRVIIGGSDAGAHHDMLATFGFFTDFVGPTVRDRQLITLEDAVCKVTSVPADLYGLRDRGRLAPGAFADVVVFDPDTVGTGPVGLRMDMPKQQPRLFAAATGVDEVIVNGVTVVEQGEVSGDTPGSVLRSDAATRSRS